MELRDYKFKSLKELASVAGSVFAFLNSKIKPNDVDYTKIIEYKEKQLVSLLKDNYDITPERLMMYLSCPIGIENTDDISNFGIRTNSNPSNGRVNMHLSKRILSEALFDNDLYDVIFDDELDDIDTLPTSGDYLDLLSPSLLNEPDLLYYLFFTGRGEEFNRIFGDIDCLKKFENGTFDGEEVYRKISSVKSSEKEKQAQLLKDFVKQDELTINTLEDKEQIKVSKVYK